MAQTAFYTRQNPDGTVTYVDPVTGASRTFTSADPATQRLVSDNLNTPGAVAQREEVQRQVSQNRSSSSSNRASTTSTQQQTQQTQYLTQSDLQRALQQALQNQPSVDDIIRRVRDLIQDMQPEAPPPIDIQSASQSALEAINPLLEQTRNRISEDFNRGQSILQAQLASGFSQASDPAIRAARELEQDRARAFNELAAAAQAQVADQAAQLIGLQQGRFRNQQEANQAAQQLALALGQTAFSNVGSNIDRLLDAYTRLSNTDISNQQLAQAARIANLNALGDARGQLIDLILGLIQLGSGNALRQGLGG